MPSPLIDPIRRALFGDKGAMSAEGQPMHSRPAADIEGMAESFGRFRPDRGAL